jgi:hypothetical protein
VEAFRREEEQEALREMIHDYMLEREIRSRRGRLFGRADKIVASVFALAVLALQIVAIVVAKGGH